jgi:hypothetical protein
MTTDGEGVKAVLSRVSEGSVLLSELRALTSKVDSTAGSRNPGIGKFIPSWVGSSVLYRWLTAEPEPDVIVIDLRETWTVGPVVAVLDWGVGFLASYWEGSQMSRVLGQCRNLVERGAETQIGQVMAALLLPPEPADDPQSADALGKNAGNSDEREGVPENVDADDTVSTEDEYLDRR